MKKFFLTYLLLSSYNLTLASDEQPTSQNARLESAYAVCINKKGVCRDRFGGPIFGITKIGNITVVNKIPHKTFDDDIIIYEAVAKDLIEQLYIDTEKTATIVLYLSNAENYGLTIPYGFFLNRVPFSFNSQMFDFFYIAALPED